MKAAKRVLFAGLFHETNTFVEGVTPLEAFAVARGAGLLECTGDSSPMGGALAAARGLGWEVVPAIDMRAMPSGMVSDLSFEVFWQAFRGAALEGLAAGVDAVFLVLHGAMVTESHTDVEGELLARIRALPGLGQVPVFGVFDLHANFTQRMAENSNCLVAYRCNPHTDARAAAVRAVGLLERALLTGEVPQNLWCHPPVLWPPTGTGTADEPMRTLLAHARELEARSPEFWCVNVVAGFSFADTAEAGVSFTVCTSGAREQALEALSLLGQLAWENRVRGNVCEAPAAQVLREALESPCGGLTVVAEPSDNIGGGAPGDGTGLLRAFLALEVPNAAVALADAAAVGQIHDWVQNHGGVGVGDAGFGEVVVSIGGKGSSLDEGPLELAVQVVSISDGRFELADKQSHLASVSGDHFEMGPCAVVRCKNVIVLLTSRPTPPMDVAQWTSQGLNPADFSYLGVKAAVAHRGAYEPIAKRMLWAYTPGPCTSLLASLSFRHVRRPVFPLDLEF